MLALLIISHPDDTKFKNTIVQKLQIEWMLKDPKQLDVRQGFWKGVNASNLYSVFTREEEREAEVDLLANYSRLFGGSFDRAKKDITSFLPRWARGVVHLEGPSALSGIKEPDVVRSQHEKASGSKADKDAPAKVPVYPAEEVARLREYLAPSSEQPAVPEKETQTLVQWLADQLTSADGEDNMLLKWCEEWGRRLDKAQSYQEQEIVQSLFLQSVRRLHGLYTDDKGIPSVQEVAATQHPEDPNFKAALHELYIIVDGEDQEMRPALAGNLEQQASAFLQALPAYRALEDVNQRLTLHVQAEHANRQLRRLVQATPSQRLTAAEGLVEFWQAQQSMLYHVTTSPRFSAYFYGVIAFETMRTLALLQCVEESGDQLSHDDWYTRREVLLRPDVAASLQLTGWQLRALLLPGPHCRRVLTSWQYTVFESKFCGAGTMGLDEYKPMPISHNEFPQDKKLDDMVKETLRKLFGTVQKPQGLPSTPRPRTPEPTALPASDTTPTADPTPSTPLRASAATVPDTSCAPTTAMAPSVASTWSATTAYTSQSPTRRPSLDTSGLAQSASPNGGNPPTMNINGIDGQTSNLKKRPGGLVDPRQAKIPRLGWRGDLDTLREGVRHDLNRGLEDLKASKEHSQQELGAIKTDLGALKGDVGSINTDLHAFKADVRWVNTDLARVKVDVGSINKHLGGLRDDLAAFQTKLSTEQDKHRADGESAKADMKQVREEMVSNTERLKTVEAGLQEIQTGLDTKFRDMFAAIEEVKSISSKAPPRPEDEGYLIRVCPAADGQSQRDYESRLYRACLSYMYILWDPFYDEEGGLGLDPGALDQTLKKFPDLDKHVLLNALENFHRQVFNCPLTRVIAVADLVEEPHDEEEFLAGGNLS